MDSPLNLAHQQARRADHVLKSGKFEEGIFCHKRAAEHILDAMQLTLSNHALESLKLQHQYHLKQQDLIRGRQHRAEKAALEETKAKQIVEALQKSSPLSEVTQSPNFKSNITSRIGTIEDRILSDAESNDVYKTMVDTDSLLQYLADRHYGNSSFKDYESTKEPSSRNKPRDEILAGAVKSPKGEKTVIEELRIHNEELRKHIIALLKELESCETERSHLAHKWEQFEHAQTLYLDTVDTDDLKLPSLELPPLEMPHFDFELTKSLDTSSLHQSKQGNI